MAVGYLASGGAAVVGEHHRGLRTDGELADEPVVGVVVAEDPAGAVEIDDHRQRPGDALWAQDAHRHLTGRAAGHGGVLDVDGQLVDRAGLDRIDGPATLVRAELKQERRSSVGISDGLGLRLEVDGVGHDCLLLRAAAVVLSEPLDRRSRRVARPAPGPWQARRWLGRPSAQRAAGASRCRCWTGPAQHRSPRRAPRRWRVPRILAASRRPRSAPATPTWLTASLARSIGTFSPRTTAADVSMPSGCASRRGRLAVPIDRLATTSLQRLRSRTGPLA